VQQRYVSLRRKRRELRRRRLGHEACELEVAAMNLDDDAGVGAERTAVIVDVGAIRGSDLDESRAALAHDLGDAEAATDLDQLAARDDRVASVGKRVEYQHERRRAVVDHERILGARQLPQKSGAVGVARSTRAASDIVLEIREPGGDAADRVDRDARQWRTAEIRVEDDAGPVEHAA